MNNRSGAFVVLVAATLGVGACKKSDGAGWHTYEVGGHRVKANLPASATAGKVMQGDKIAGYQLQNEATFGNVSITSTPPVLMAPESVKDYKAESIADGKVTSWWVPSPNTSEGKSYSVYYQRRVDGIEITCGGTYVKPAQLEAVKGICMSLAPDLT